MFQPKLIEKEKDLKCRSNHSYPIQYVILDQYLSSNQRLVCQYCEKINQQNTTIVEYQIIKQCLEDQQREKIKQFELIITPQINFLRQLEENLSILKTRLIQQLDELLWLTNGWINTIADSITSYSFFESLNSLIQLQERIIDFSWVIDKTRKIYQDWKIKLNPKLQLFKLCPEFKKCQELIESLEKVVEKQEDISKSQQIDKIKENSFLFELKQQLRNSQQKNKLIITDTIYVMKEAFIPKKKQFSVSKVDKQIIYTSSDEQIIRRDLVSQKQDILRKWEQIHYLQWIGLYGENSEKLGYWKATWEGITIPEVGGYYNNGDKSGEWVDIISNYWSEAKAFEIGYYDNNKRRGTWQYKYRNNLYGGGTYNQRGEKFGKWIEIWEGFWNQAQITYSGDYSMKGNKVGRWDIMYCMENRDVEYYLIGGGSYDKEESQKKIGQWVELDDQFYKDKQVTFKGEYNINGMKVGRWDTWYDKYGYKVFKQIGGGSYDNDGGQQKIGQWVELDDGFYKDKQVTHSGGYSLNSTKVGRWDIWFNKNGDNQWIGGGQYDEKLGQKKFGKWVELDDGFSLDKQVTFIGEYNAMGMKIDRWDIMYCHPFGDGKFKKIGGGTYDQEGSQKKIGKWVELSDNFVQDKEIIQSGEYNSKGTKTGIWVQKDLSSYYKLAQQKNQN